MCFVAVLPSYNVLALLVCVCIWWCGYCLRLLAAHTSVTTYAIHTFHCICALFAYVVESNVSAEAADEINETNEILILWALCSTVRLTVTMILFSFKILLNRFSPSRSCVLLTLFSIICALELSVLLFHTVRNACFDFRIAYACVCVCRTDLFCVFTRGRIIHSLSLCCPLYICITIRFSTFQNENAQ